MDDNKNWRFGVVGNIVRSYIDEEGVIRYGTRAYSGGARVYLNGKYWYRGMTEISVIGLNRYGRYALESMPLKLIENIRFQRVYKPRVLEIMEYVEVIDNCGWWGRRSADRKEAKAFVKWATESRIYIVRQH